MIWAWGHDCVYFATVKSKVGVNADSLLMNLMSSSGFAIPDILIGLLACLLYVCDA